MSDWTAGRRLVAYGAALVVVFAIGLGAGRLGPELDATEPVVHDAPHVEATTTTASSSTTTTTPGTSTTITVSSGFGHDHSSHTGGTTAP